MTPPNPACEVFNIPELCGLIFDYLSHEDIFRLQNLTKACRIHLHDFKPWQKSIFHRDAITSFPVKPKLAESEGKKVAWFLVSGPSSGDQLPNMESQERGLGMGVEGGPSSGLPCFGLGATLPRSPSHASRDYQMQNVKLNWLLIQKFPKFSYYPSSNMLGFEEDVPVGDYFTNSDASYRSLLLTDPPLAEVTIMDPRGKVYEAANPEGLSMGDLVDAMLEGSW